MKANDNEVMSVTMFEAICVTRCILLGNFYRVFDKMTLPYSTSYPGRDGWALIPLPPALAK